MCVCIYMYISLCVCVSVYIYIYIYIYIYNSCHLPQVAGCEWEVCLACHRQGELRHNEPANSILTGAVCLRFLGASGRCA